jgi:hypothetical protein
LNVDRALPRDDLVLVTSRACKELMVRSGSKGDVPPFPRHARFAPKGGHSVHEIVGWVKRLVPSQNDRFTPASTCTEGRLAIVTIGN